MHNSMQNHIGATEIRSYPLTLLSIVLNDRNERIMLRKSFIEKLSNQIVLIPEIVIVAIAITAYGFNKNASCFFIHFEIRSPLKP